VEHDGYTYIFLTGARKNFHHEVPDDWENVAYERFDYVECGVWRKRTDALTEKDRSDWVEYRGEPDDEFVSPHNWTWPKKETAMSDVTIHYTPTADLRFVRRIIKLDPFYKPNEAVARILQQRFAGDDGSERWIDVPECQE
jgi:hypothetical protein